MLKRFLFASLLLMIICVVASATTITVSSFQVPNMNWGGTTCTLRVYADAGFTDSLGVPYMAGNPASAQSSFQTVNCTLAGTTVTLPSFTLPSTTNALVNNRARLTARFYDSRGVAREFLFTSFFVPFSPTTTTWQVFAQVNSAQPKPQPSLFLDTVGVQALISAQIGSGTATPVASDAIQGKLKTSVAPASSLDPIARGINDTVTPVAITKTGLTGGLILGGLSSTITGTDASVGGIVYRAGSFSATNNTATNVGDHNITSGLYVTSLFSGSGRNDNLYGLELSTSNAPAGVGNVQDHYGVSAQTVNYGINGQTHGVYSDVVQVGPGNDQNLSTSVFQGQYRQLGSGGHALNVAGLRLSNWTKGTSTVDTSYGIYLDSSIGIGTTKYAIRSDSSAPSVLMGTLTIAGNLATTGVGTTSSVPKFFDGPNGIIGNSQITDNGTTVAIANTLAGKTVNIANAATGTVNIGNGTGSIVNIATGGDGETVNIANFGNSSGVVIGNGVSSLFQVGGLDPSGFFSQFNTTVVGDWNGVGNGVTVAMLDSFDRIDLAATHVDPSTTYRTNLGQLSKKYLTLHTAELWAETLVAQNTLATIGGRILVGPTSPLITDLAPATVAIQVKYNNLASGDRVYMEANNSVEFMAITSGATPVTGGYQYNVTRNLDGTGANQWYAGDAVFNTGQTGNGFIDLYSTRGVSSASEVGPTIVGNIRNSATYNDWSPSWAIGNLQGLYGYGGSTPGVAFGKYAASNTHLTIDSTNGYRIFNGTSTVIGQWDTAGVITVGQVAASQSNVQITAGQLNLRNNATTRIRLASDGSGFLANSLIAWDTSGNLTVTGNATISGWTIGTDFIRDTADSTGLASTVTGGDDVRFYAGVAFAGRAAAPFRVTEAGALTATSATITGAITASSGSITGPLTVSGASGSLSLGTTPPSSATVGTGLWLDRTGLYGLLANVQQVKLLATTGAITAGAGKTTLDGSGVTIDNSNTVYGNRVNWAASAGATATGYVLNFRNATDSGTQLYATTFGGGDTTDNASTLIAAANTSDFDARVQVFKNGTTAASRAGIGLILLTGIGGSFSGVQVGGTGSTFRSGTEGTNRLDIFDGTAPTGTLSNGISLYSTSGELRVMDAAGNATLLSPHDHLTNEWIYYSRNTVTGQVLRIDMERMMKALDKLLGGGFVQAYIEEVKK